MIGCAILGIMGWAIAALMAMELRRSWDDE